MTNVGAFYLRIGNGSDTTDRVVGASSPRCREIEIHETETVDGVASMARAEPAQLEVGPGEDLVFQPTGLHVMCLGLSEPVTAGERITLTIELASAGPITVEAPAVDR